MSVTENKKYSVFFPNYILILRKAYSPTIILLDKGVKVLLFKGDILCFSVSFNL